MNMVSNLVNGLGESIETNHQPEFKTFPTPERVLEAGELYLKEHVRVGHRSTYIINAATKALDPVFDLESYTSPESDITKLKEIKGIGPYAFNTLSMILGKYDLLPIDSEYKAHVIKKYFNGEPLISKSLKVCTINGEVINSLHIGMMFTRQQPLLTSPYRLLEEGAS
ncbi:hypothetical protein [Bacillus sp. SD088]|uniref:hypothetical protein n=1 Tax=Bacillus sp. SD088 TaxID=2782012 RepID=UPI001F606938|nr:hypothetical protein [Bacillus sp. SD088]